MATAKPKQPKPDWLKAKVRTPRMTMDIDGPLKSALPDLIHMLNAEDRACVIKRMQEKHVEICKREAGQVA